MRFTEAAVCALLPACLASCGDLPAVPASPSAVPGPSAESPAPVVQELPPEIPDVIFSGAGDIANCIPPSEQTAQLLDGLSGSVFTLGDNAYPSGTAERFAKCYEPTWGRHRARTRPAPGNHDWSEAGGAPYFAYFGAAAGPPGHGYYSFDLGAWHILSLNSNIRAGRGSPQYEFVRRDLESTRGACVLAYWHHPVFSSGPQGSQPQMREIWRVLDEADADVVLAGHEHSYERFAPQDADGRRDANGLRQFVVGTGGTGLRAFRVVVGNSEARSDDTFGVLKLVLKAASYDWEFVPVVGQSFRDAGTAGCVTRRGAGFYRSMSQLLRLPGLAKLSPLHESGDASRSARVMTAAPRDDTPRAV